MAETGLIKMLSIKRLEYVLKYTNETFFLRERDEICNESNVLKQVIKS